LVPDSATENGMTVGRIGVGVAEPLAGGLSMFTEVRYGVVEGMTKAVRQTWETSVLSLQMIGRMLLGEISWKNLSGPVTIADYAGQTAQLGLSHYLKFVAMISISLGVLNLLPIPVLDGGHLLYYVVEIIKGGPIPERVMEIGQQIGLALLVMLMAFAFYNDINRLISG
jgi:regulator of sigma E protease